jgi:hypothetical protein
VVFHRAAEILPNDYHIVSVREEPRVDTENPWRLEDKQAVVKLVLDSTLEVPHDIGISGPHGHHSLAILREQAPDLPSVNMRVEFNRRGQYFIAVGIPDQALCVLLLQFCPKISAVELKSLLRPWLSWLLIQDLLRDGGRVDLGVLQTPEPILNGPLNRQVLVKDDLDL